MAKMFLRFAQVSTSNMTHREIIDPTTFTSNSGFRSFMIATLARDIPGVSPRHVRSTRSLSVRVAKIFQAGRHVIMATRCIGCALSAGRNPGLPLHPIPSQLMAICIWTTITRTIIPEPHPRQDEASVVKGGHWPLRPRWPAESRLGFHCGQN
jgi:hypothetical protein